MSSPFTSHSIYRFSNFEVDARSGEVRKNGVRLRIQDQPFQILLKLLERAGQVVTREELRSTLWEAGTFVDFDNGLNMTMKRLREVLGDLPERPVFIETVPRRGYRFIAPVQKLSSEASPPAAISEHQTIQRIRPATWLALLAAVVAMLCAIGTWFWRSHTDAARLPIEVVPLAGLSGLEAVPAFSPDGNQVVFSLEGALNSGIYTTVIGSERPLRLTSEGCCPRWSPDGRQIAYIGHSEGGLTINVISALGGSGRRLYSGPANYFPHTLDWSPDGKVLAFAQAGVDKTHGWIALLSLDDYTIRRLTSPSGEDLDYAPAFSPDGSTVAFVRTRVTGVVTDLYVVPVTGGQCKRLTFDNRWIYCQIAWTADGREIVFSSDRRGVTSLWRVSASGGAPQPVVGVGKADSPSISPKGNLLAYKQDVEKANFWEVALSDEKHRRGSPTMLISQTGWILRPQFSPDGRRIVFQSDRLGYMEIWACDRDGSNCGQLTSLERSAGAPRWSPDGRYVAFEFRPKEHSEIYVVEVPGGRPRLVPTLAGADNGGPNWSRDGQSIYFYSDRGGGPLQLWKVPFRGGSPVQMTRNGGVFGEESPDGRFLYYSKFVGDGIWKMPLEGGEETHVIDHIGNLDWSAWAIGRNGIYFIGKKEKHSRKAIQFFEFATHQITPIWTFEKPGGSGLALSADGRSLLYDQTEFSQSNIMLVKNFH